MRKSVTVSIPKHRFLTGISLVYLFTFTSLYIQLPGLYGENGITPARSTGFKKPSGILDFLENPNLLRLSSLINLTAYQTLEICILSGVVLSFISAFMNYFNGILHFTTLWLLYFSVFKAGSTFMHQWDALLLEAGFIAILLSGWFRHNAPSNRLGMWLLRWLLFRFLFIAGVVRLTRDSPTWWSLTGVKWYNQMQVIPNAVSWYVHQLPDWIHMLSTAVYLIIRLPLSFLFFVPLSAVRKFSFYSQLLVQGILILTGNYGTLNLLIIALSYSLLKDEDFVRGKKGNWRASTILSRFFITAVLAASFWLFQPWISADYTIKTSIGFSKEQFNQALHYSVLCIVYFSVALYFAEVVSSLVQAVTSGAGRLRKLSDLTGVLLVGSVGSALLFGNLVPLASLDKAGIQQLPEAVHKIHKSLEVYHLTNSYNIFPRLTGLGGRAEVIVEGGPTETGPWTEYEFRFKPGRLNRSPSLVVPHQPRIDFQMWITALSSYDKNPWFTNFVYRLLQQQPTVLSLLDSKRMPIEVMFIRAQLYTYQYTKSLKSLNWWNRVKRSEYLPPVSLASPLLRSAVERSGLVGKRLQAPPADSRLSRSLEAVRSVIGQPPDLSPLLLVCFILVLTRYSFSRSPC